MRNKILFFIKIPPPVTGATLINKQVYESMLIRENFLIRSIPISYMSKLNEMAKFKISKAKKFIYIFVMLFYELLFKRPDLVYFQISTHGISLLRDTIFVIIIKIFNVRILYHIHVVCKSHNKLQKYILNFALKNESIICLSKVFINDFKSIRSKSIHVVNNGISDQKMRISRSSCNCNVNLLFLSNLMYSKGIYDYIETLRILKENNVPFKGYIIGSEHDVTQNDINKLLLKYNLASCVEYLGAVYGNKKFQILSKCDILIYPTHDDAFPNVILEGLMTNTCIIATNIGAISEMVDDGINGFIVDKKNPGQIAEKVDCLAKDRCRIEEIKIKARKKYINNYTDRKFEKNMINVFNECLSQL